MLIFRQLFDAASSTYTYLLGDSLSGEGMLIDPVFEQVPRDAALLRELGLQLTWTLDTHVHADHVTGAALLRQRLAAGWRWRRWPAPVVRIVACSMATALISARATSRCAPPRATPTAA